MNHRPIRPLPNAPRRGAFVRMPRSRMLVLALVVPSLAFVALAPVACTADDNTQAPKPVDASLFGDTHAAPVPDSGGDAAMDEDAAKSATEDGGDASQAPGACDASGAASCADLAEPTASVAYGTSNGALPIAAGGSITPGVYALTAQTTYVSGDAGAESEAGAPGGGSAIAFDACGHFTLTTFTAGDDAGAAASTFAGTFSTSGTTLRLVEDCPAVEGLTPLLYTATATSITLLAPADPLTGTAATSSVYAKE